MSNSFCATSLFKDLIIFGIGLALGGAFHQVVGKESVQKQQNLVTPKEQFVNGVSQAITQLANNTELGDFLDSVEKHIKPQKLDVEGGGFELGGVGELTYSSRRAKDLRLVVHTKLGGHGGVDQPDIVTSALLQFRTLDDRGRMVWKQVGDAWVEGGVGAP
jgi:hypothetical protein